MVDAITFGVSALLLLQIRIPAAVRTGGASVLADFREGWNEFVSRRWVVGMVASFSIFQLTTFPALFVLGTYVAKPKLGGSIAWGTILSVETAGAFLGGVLALRVRFGRPLVACLILALPTAGSARSRSTRSAMSSSGRFPSLWVSRGRSTSPLQ